MATNIKVKVLGYDSTIKIDAAAYPHFREVPVGGEEGQVLKALENDSYGWVDLGSLMDYEELSNKPKINSVTLIGDKSSTDLGLQSTLVSGTNIKTINSQTILGSGNISISPGLVDDVKVDGTSVVTDKVANIDLTGKQDTISDLSTIRSGAALGSTAMQPGWDISLLENDSGYITSSYHDSTKLDTISDLSTIRSNATSGKTAKDTIDTYGDIVTHDADEFEEADATILKQSNVVDSTSSTSTVYPLSANKGKLLQDEINNLKSIGRFLSIWNCTTGLPTTNPEELPYTYHTGDYFRVGAVNETSGGVNYKPNGSQYTGVASSTVETSSVKTGWVYYYDGTQWLAQSAGGNGKVVDVQSEGTTVLNESTGIANVTRDSLGLGNIVTHNTSEFATSSQGSLADSAIQPNDNISDLTNDAGYVTSDYHDNTKQDTIDDLEDIRDEASAGQEAHDWATQYGDIVTCNQEDFATSYQGSLADSALQPANILNVVTSTSTTDALSANMGKELQDQVNNLKNIGRFLSIWNASTGSPTSEPTTSPYTYKVGDYYRVGVAGTKNPAGNLTYTTGGTNWVEGSSLSIGDVVYCSNVDASASTTTWVRQSSGGGGTVQDVQVNSSTIIASGTGIANINTGSGLTFNTSTNTLNTVQLIQVRDIE